MATYQEQIAAIQAMDMPDWAKEIRIRSLQIDQANEAREAARVQADQQRDAEKARLDALRASGQITNEERLAGYQAANDAWNTTFQQAVAQRSQVIQSTLPAGFTPDTRTMEQIQADLAQRQAQLESQSQQQLQVFGQMANLPPIPAQQAPELNREYYLSRGVPESQLPPLPGQAAQNVPPLAPSQLHSPTTPPLRSGQSFLTGNNMVNPLNPATLPALRGSATGTSSIDPTLRPYLELGLRGAEQLFLQQQPSLYPGQMFVSPSEQTQAALNMQEDIALAQPTSLQAAQEAYMRGLGGLSATAGGAFLMGNPFQQAAIEAASRPIQQQFAQTTLPGIASGFSRAGRYGSQAMGTALGSATEATARALGDVGTQIAYGGYEAERGRQQQAMGAQLQAATLAPQIYGQQFLPSQQLAQVGAAREAIAGQPLQEAIQRYQFQQQIPYQQLQGFLSSIYGTPMAASQYAPPAQTNTAASVLGGAATGAGIGRLLQQGGVGDIFGFNPGTFGAVAGGLGGLLF
jgi:hypothetical protein